MLEKFVNKIKNAKTDEEIKKYYVIFM